jgi:hypothetical protein
LSYTLRVPLQATTALEEEGLDDFNDLVTIVDDQVLAIVKNCRRCFHGDPGAGAAGAAAPAAGRGGRGGRGCGGRGGADAAVAAVRQTMFMNVSTNAVPCLVTVSFRVQ